MANYASWNVRKRHEWLAKPLKKKRVKRRAAMRIGLWDAWQRKAAKNKTAESAPAEETAETESGEQP
jgi:hypothetical protein